MMSSGGSSVQCQQCWKNKSSAGLRDGGNASAEWVVIILPENGSGRGLLGERDAGRRGLIGHDGGIRKFPSGDGSGDGVEHRSGEVVTGGVKDSEADEGEELETVN